MTVRSVCLPFAICTLLAISLHPINARAANGSTAIDRLAGLGRLWGAIKYFDPQLAYRTDIDWDGALAGAVPAVEDATTPKKYAAAISNMLVTLDDPADRVLGDEPVPPGEGSALNIEERAGGVVLVQLTSYAAMPTQDTAKTFRHLRLLIPHASGVVFDLRSPQSPSEGDFETFEQLWDEAHLTSLLSATATQVPGRRTREYVGLPSITGSVNSGYGSYFEVADGRQVAGEGRSVPTVFLVNADSQLPDEALALVAAAKAGVVSDGTAPRTADGVSDSMALPDGITIEFRSSELLAGDGPAGLAADATVDASSPNHRRAALSRALAYVQTLESTKLISQPTLPPAVERPADRYADMQFPAVGYRMLGVFRMWAAIHYFHPFSDPGWDAAYREAIANELTARTPLAYQLALCRFYAYSRDSHGGYPYSALLMAHYGAAPPIVVRPLHGHAVVTALLGAAARESGLRVGDTIASIDGTPIARKIAQVAPYRDASTRQSLLEQIESNQGIGLFTGPDGSSLQLAFRAANGNLRNVTLRRSRRWSDDPRAFVTRTGPAVLILPGNVGYVDLARISQDALTGLIPKLAHTRGIVFDMRGHPTANVQQIALALVAKPSTLAVKMQIPVIRQAATDDTGGISFAPEFREIDGWFPPPSGSGYRRPTDMLVDARAISAAEQTAIYFAEANGTRFIGEPTAGADGDITEFAAPGGMIFHFTGMRILYGNGRALQRIGLIPVVRVEPNAADIRTGNDPVIQAGLKDVLTRAHVPPAKITEDVKAEAGREQRVFYRGDTASRSGDTENGCVPRNVCTARSRRLETVAGN